MSVRTRDELLEEIRNRLGDQTDDESITFLEDISDTIYDLETRAQGDGVDWKAKYEENDSNWRTKYIERFYSTTPETSEETEETPKKPMTFAELFKTV